MIATGPFRYPGWVPAWSPSPPSTSTILLNASGDKVALIIQAPKDGTLEYFEWYALTVGNNPDNGMRLSFQTVDPATGLPDGTADQFVVMPGPFSSATWYVPASAMTDDGTGGGVKRTVTQGEYLALVLDFASFVASDSITVRIFGAASGITSQIQNGYVGDGSTGTYAKQNTALLGWALKYDDGTYAQIPSVWPIADVSTVTFNSGSTPDERALKFQLPFAARFTGANVSFDCDNPCDIILYDAANAVLSSISVEGVLRVAGNNSFADLSLDTDVELAANTTYRLAVKPTTGSSVSLSQITIGSTGVLGAIASGPIWQLSTRTDGGSWDDSATTTVPLISLILNGVDTDQPGSSGGETAHVFVA